MLTACWRKTGIFAQNLFEKASFLEIVYALLNYISRWSVLFLFCFCFSWQLLSQRVFVFTLILLLPWSPQLDGNTSSSHKRCCLSWGLPGPCTAFRSGTDPGARQSSTGCPGMLEEMLSNCHWGGDSGAHLWLSYFHCVEQVCVQSVVPASQPQQEDVVSSVQLVVAVSFCLFVSCVFQSAWGTWWWFFHLGMSSMCSDATDC